MTLILPPQRPDLSPALVAPYLEQHELVNKPFIFARRGYYRDTMGEAGVNDIGIYDDAFAIIDPAQGIFTPFNGNTDPSKHDTSMAHLTCGLWSFELGIHNKSKSVEHQYPALIQGDHTEFVLFREGTELVQKGIRDNRGLCLGNGLWRGIFGINNHRGGNTTTGSLGCQTVPPPQWDEYLTLAKHVMAFHQLKRIPYLLTERT